MPSTQEREVSEPRAYPLLASSAGSGAPMESTGVDPAGARRSEGISDHTPPGGRHSTLAEARRSLPLTGRWISRWRGTARPARRNTEPVATRMPPDPSRSSAVDGAKAWATGSQTLALT